MCAQTHTYTHERESKTEKSKTTHADREIASEGKTVRKREHLMTGIVRHKTIRKMMDGWMGGWIKGAAIVREREKERIYMENTYTRRQCT